MSEKARSFDYLHTAPYEAIAKVALDNQIDTQFSSPLLAALKQPEKYLNTSLSGEIRNWGALNELYADLSEIFADSDLVIPDAATLEERGFDLKGLKEKHELIKYSGGEPLLLLTPRCFIEGQIFDDMTKRFGIGLDLEGYIKVADSQEYIKNWCPVLAMNFYESGLGFLPVEWLLGVVDTSKQDYQIAIYTVPLHPRAKSRINASLHINEYILAQILLKKRGQDMMDTHTGALLLTGSNVLSINHVNVRNGTITPKRVENSAPAFHHRVMTRRTVFNEPV